jgi:nucleoside-diphosphate-sugar epimerase
VRALVTGHRGFVGRHMSAALERAGYAVTGIDLVDGIDARDVFRFDDTHFDLVVHLAAVVGGRATIEGAPLRLAVDLAIDAELFGWALRTRPGRIVYYSSSAAYPTALQDPIGQAVGRLREDDINLAAIATPDLTYGWAKLTGEMLAAHAEAEGLRVHVLRPFSGYAGDQDECYPFPAFIARAARRADPFEVWGTGEQVRDFIHIDDVVAGTLAAIAADVPGPVNLCTGRGVSFNELAALVTTAAGYTPRVQHRLDAPVGVAYRVGDPTKLHTVYTPRITLEEGIARALS